MLLHQMAHLGHWEGPNVLSLSAPSKVWSQNGKFPKRHPKISCTKQRELFGGCFPSLSREQWIGHNHKCHGTLSFPPETSSGGPDQDTALPTRVAGRQYDLLVAPHRWEWCGSASCFITLSFSFPTTNEKKNPIAASQDCFADQIK